MPFKSEAQRRLFYAKRDSGEIDPKVVAKWERGTKGKLPEKVAHIWSAFADEIEKVAVEEASRLMYGPPGGGLTRLTKQQKATVELFMERHSLPPHHLSNKAVAAAGGDPALMARLIKEQPVAGSTTIPIPGNPGAKPGQPGFAQGVHYRLSNPSMPNPSPAELRAAGFAPKAPAARTVFAPKAPVARTVPRMAPQGMARKRGLLASLSKLLRVV